MNSKKIIQSILITILVFSLIPMNGCKENENNGGSMDNSSTGSKVSDDTSDDINRSGFDLDSSAAFSLDNPSGVPDFSTEEIRQQKQAGLKLLAEIQQAAQDNSRKEFVVPAGNYGFDIIRMESGVPSGFVLKNVKRTEENPFVIKAQGVTFWFELTKKPAPNASRAVHLVNCENISIEGLTIDAYTANNIEGKLTNIDVPNNRIEIKLSEGTINDEAILTSFTGNEVRIVPVKANGDSIPALYNINNTWGVEYMFIRKVEKSPDGYWLYFRNQLLLNTIFEDDWLSSYGKEGTLETGDGICLIYGSIMGIALDNAKKITVQDFSCYIGRASFWENGGYGDHRWIDCRFMTRPGTNRIIGGDCSMTQGIRVGSTYDRLYMGRTTDDAMNIHGFWSEVKSGSGTKYLMGEAPVGIQAGDPAEIYSNDGKLVAVNKVKETPVSIYNYNGSLSVPITFESEMPEFVETMKIRWPNSECAGWKVTNSTFDGTYQRILIQTGPGLFENNFIRNMGSYMAIDTNTADYEGGFLQDIIVRNNVFINSGIYPGASTIKVIFVPHWAANRQAENIKIQGNVIFTSGASAIDLTNTSSVSIEDNQIFDLYSRSNRMVPYLELKNTMVTSSGSKNLVIKGNQVFLGTDAYDGNGIVNEPASIESNTIKAGAQDIIDQIRERVRNKKNVSFEEFIELIPR
jgi:hypothetical protein